MKMGNGGQMRVVEAMIACVILIIGLSTTAYFSSVFTTEEGGDIEEAGQGVLHVLDSTDLIKQVILNEGDWESKLKSLLETLLPPDTLYNLTLVSGLTDQPIAVITNMMGQDPSLSLDAVSLQQVITVSLPLARIEQRELDVMLIIDRSGSMNEKEYGDPNPKIYYAKEAAKTFVDQLNASKDRVGLASFSDTASLDIALTSNFGQVKSKIDSLTVSGYTNIGGGVNKANAEFSSNGREGTLWAIILLSDGMANRPCPHVPTCDPYKGCDYARDYARNESHTASEMGTVIYTIGLGSDTKSFDEGLLKEMQTNGYYYAPSGQDLMDIYMAIAQDLLFAVKYDIVIITLTLVKAG